MQAFLNDIREFDGEMDFAKYVKQVCENYSVDELHDIVGQVRYHKESVKSVDAKGIADVGFWWSIELAVTEYLKGENS